jgi:L-lactate dehydrogenase complex protein LldF
MAWFLKAMARRGVVHALPVAQGWFAVRDFPAPQGRTFQQQWRARK